MTLDMAHVPVAENRSHEGFASQSVVVLEQFGSQENEKTRKSRRGNP